jgi:hypothetical protein
MDDDILHFHCCRDFDGSIRPVDLYRRNGRLAVCVHRVTSDAGPVDAEDPFIRHRTVLAAGLTAIEERTWHRLVSGWSIDVIAAAEGVSRAAIYARIRGSHGTGGMVHKNAWVAHWWQRRQRERS